MQNDLSKIPIFASLPESELQELAGIIEVRKFSRGEVLFMEGDPVQGLYFVQSGKVQMSKVSYAGKQSILQIYSKGEVLAEAVLFSEASYPATAEAVESSTVYFLGLDAMQEVMLRHPLIAVNVVKVLSARLRTAQERLKYLSYAKAEGRIAKLLQELADSYGRMEDSGVFIDVEMTHARLASLTGLTRETVSRVLSAWRTDKVISTEHRKIILLDMKTLEEYSKE